MSPTVEVLKPEHWEEYKNIFLKGLITDPTAFATSLKQESAHSDEEWIKKIENPNRKLYGIRAGGVLVAVAGVTFDPKENLEHSAVIGPFVTDKEYRGNGYGTLLMQAILDDLRAHPYIRKVILYVNDPQTEAQRLYERAGFKRVGTLTKETKVDNQYYDQHVMELLFDEKF